MLFNVASGQETSIKTMVERMRAVFGRPDHLIVHTEPRPGDVRRHLGGIKRLKETISFVPSVNLETGLAETIDWYKAEMARN